MYLTDVQISTAAELHPVTTNEVKDFLKLEYEVDDPLVDSLISTAVDWVERFLNRSLINKTYVAYFENHDVKVRLPYSPIVSVTTVERIKDNVTTTLTENTDYYVKGVQDKFLYLSALGISSPPPGVSPHEMLGGYDLKVTYVAGYGYDREDVPEQIKHGIIRLCSYLYEQRNEVQEGQILNKVPFGIKAVLMPYSNCEI